MDEQYYEEDHINESDYEPAIDDSYPEEEEEFVEKTYRVRKKTKTKLWRLVLFVVAVILITAGFIVSYFTPIFALKHVVVEGNTITSSNKIVQASKLRFGTPLPKVSTSEAGKNIVKSFKEVKSVNVQLSFPNTVTIHIKQRVAVAVVNQMYLIDQDGVIFGETAQPGNLPALKSSDPKDIQESGPTTKEALLSFSELDPDIKSQVTVISADDPDNVTFTLKDGKQIIYGDAKDYQAKNKVLKALLTVKGKIYNVSAPDLPTVK